MEVPQLTRQQIRQIERLKKKNPRYNMTVNQVEQTAKEAINQEYEKIKNDLKDNICHTYTKIIVSCFLMSLHDLYGFGNQRMNKLLANFENTLESVNGGFVSVEDIVEQCRVEFGIDLEDRMVGK